VPPDCSPAPSSNDLLDVCLCVWEERALQELKELLRLCSSRSPDRNVTGLRIYPMYLQVINRPSIDNFASYIGWCALIQVTYSTVMASNTVSRLMDSFGQPLAIGTVTEFIQRSWKPD
jgi:hypothetical protein